MNSKQNKTNQKKTEGQKKGQKQTKQINTKKA